MSALAKWKDLGLAILGALLVLSAHLALERGLLITVGIFPEYPPPHGIRGLLAVGVFLAALIASYRPLLPQQRCSLWWACFRGLLWAALAAGLAYQLACLYVRFNLMRPKPYPDVEPILAIFGVVWTIVFSVLADESRKWRVATIRP